MLKLTERTNEYSQEYLTFKKELDTELNKAADGFVKIGYLLRQAEESNVLETSGYRNVAEFAAAEYGLSKDVVSRYININKRYSEGGYSPVLAERYHGFGMAKLAEMLTLPQAIIDTIPEELSKTEIREIKKEFDAEQGVTDIEIAIEAAGQPEEQREDTLLTKVVRAWLHDIPDDFRRLSSAIYPDYDIDKMMDIIAPDETRVIIVRVPGVGRLMMTCSISASIKIVTMRTGENGQISWEDLCSAASAICARRYPDERIEEVWARTYDDPYPEEKKEEPKPEPRKEVKNEEKKPAKRKESKVTVAKPVKKEEPKKQYEKPVIVEMHHDPEVLERDEEEVKNAAEADQEESEHQKEGTEEQETYAPASTGYWGYTDNSEYEATLEELRDDMKDLAKYFEQKNYSMAKQTAAVMNTEIESLLKIMEKHNNG
ncbi:MAG: hypothetical protein J6C99_02895 [Lachnospiraceae bacterium]|nr:hypothetical protein [Lachnospiraceae bacterium]